MRLDILINLDAKGPEVDFNFCQFPYIHLKMVIILIFITLNLPGSIGVLVGRFNFGQPSQCLALSHDNQSLLVGLQNGQIQQLNLSQSPTRLTFQSKTKISSMCSLNQNGTLVALANDHGEVVIMMSSKNSQEVEKMIDNESTTEKSLKVTLPVNEKLAYLTCVSFEKDRHVYLLAVNEARNAAWIVAVKMLRTNENVAESGKLMIHF